ncbi:hypothetical protein [Lentzea sp. NPDC051838]|uniref:hypothetical protein n=1 Tax=Lentzea sp. NPDC051838 TaxID=3154849 RepID=UPI0034167C04
MSEPTAPQRLLQFAEQVRVPEALSQEGLAARFGAPDDVEVRVGQVWRACWNEISALLLVTEVQDLTIDGVPVTLDLPAAPDRGIVINGSFTAFGLDAMAWSSLSERFPLRILDQVVDSWPDEVVDEIRRRPADSPTQPGSWSDEVIWAELTDDLAELRAVPTLPIEVAGEKGTPLQSLLGPGLDLRSLVTALLPIGYSQPDVMALLHGKKPLSPQAADVVAKVTGIDRRDVEAAVVAMPRGFAAEVDHPRWRRVWRRRAEQRGVDEATARLEGGYEYFVRAARETGSGPVDWRARLAQYFQREEQERKSNG